jgi:glycosyltransferase involved in cell wall biosynthesis
MPGHDWGQVSRAVQPRSGIARGLPLAASVGRLAAGAIRFGLRRYARALPRRRTSARERPDVVILLMSAWGMGGTIRAAHTLAGYLAQRGHRVELVSVFRVRHEPFFGSFPDGVEVSALDDRRERAAPLAARPVRALLRRLPSVLVHPVERSQHWNLWVDVQLVRRLRRRSGVLITTRPSLNLIAADLSPPGLVTIGLEQVNLDAWRPRLQAAMARYYPRLDALVTLTEQDRRAYAELLRGQGPTRIERIPNTAHALGGPAPDLAAPVVVAAGRLTLQKGFDLLIEAFAEVAAAHGDWRLRIFGSGELAGELEAMIAGRGLGGSVELAGATNELGAEMAKASIFALSSRREGFPLALLEAMSKGLAVVSFDCPTGPADVIDDHANGILVPHGDARAFAAALRELIEDEPLRRRLAAAAAVTAREYRIDVVGRRWEALIAELTAIRRAR